ncbi:MAG: hypothetical protein FJZ61_06505 [Chlamydiae bacterium]|nr:hypothetical protein [Chlamydiota bacterium]
MSNIPPGDHYTPSPTSNQFGSCVPPKKPGDSSSLVSSIARFVITLSNKWNKYTASLNRNVTEDGDKTKYSIEHPTILSLQERELELKDHILKTLKPPYPALKAFQGIIGQIKGDNTLLEIWTELVQRPEDNLLGDLLVEVFQVIYQKKRDLAYEAISKIDQRNQIKKRVVDCIKADDCEFFFEKAIQENAPFLSVLLLKKIYDKKFSVGTSQSEFVQLIDKFCVGKQNTAIRICEKLLLINWDIPSQFDLIYLSEFQELRVHFFEAGWGAKEEFLTKALCCFWNEIFRFIGTRSDLSPLKGVLERFENGILDIGKSHLNFLPEGNNPVQFLLFSMGILYPKIREKIVATGNSTSQITPRQLAEDYRLLDPDSKRFIGKIRTLFLTPEEAIKNLEEVNLDDKDSLPCTRVKNKQQSGSCVVKNLDSLLSMSSKAPSIIMHGGFQHHAIYAEVFKCHGQFFASVHNLGEGCEHHLQGERKKILPLILIFENSDSLIAFSKKFCQIDLKIKEYLDLVESFALNSQNKNLKSDIQRMLSLALSNSLADSLLIPNKYRANPMHPKYREFRELQRWCIRNILHPTGAPSEPKQTAIELRRTVKADSLPQEEEE